ncbi:glycerophosphodiester phosphodiesterase family protein [Nesterenkonia alkaliphila]|uniref:Glycerophosphodiester phosphodiesterase n=1 Tax=Nesterenkonia alkaliphila TaxID=1463631 RepID=A0A7K1UM57_9MICC|nr:glycerophosphodiester phosphodiesterase family protein [Nesterenkonia alkaliphila]MVT27559.1 glycerophosphodiester phosphodiesterase [Nesterenkonia alkaliphila]
MSRLPDWLTDRPITHRGLHGSGVPENSMAAFQASIEAGLPIELDVQLSADDQLVVHHDDHLQRLCGRQELVRQLSLQELTALTITGTDQQPLSFAQTLEFVDGRVPLLVEIKTGECRNLRAQAAAAALRDYRGECAVQSFDPLIVGWFAKNAPHVLRGQLSGSFAEKKDMSWATKKLLQNLGLNGISKPDFVAYEYRAINQARARLISQRWPLLLWTITAQQDMERAYALADNVIFEGFSPA